MKSQWSWTAACPGASSACVSTGYGTPSAGTTPFGVKPGGPATHGGGLRAVVNPAGRRPDVDGTRLRDLRDLRADQRIDLEQQPIQDDQGRSVFEHLFEDMSSEAPATAHMGATSVKGGVSGPYPWRRPV